MIILRVVIWSTHDLSCLKSAYSSLRSLSISCFILSMILLRSILHGIDSRVIPLKLLHCPLHQSSCICSSFQILFSNFVYAGNWQLIASGGMLSILPALPVFRFLMTLRSSVFVLCDLAGSKIYGGPASQSGGSAGGGRFNMSLKCSFNLLGWSSILVSLISFIFLTGDLLWLYSH